ncbi:MAG: hypothetical protein HRU17_21810 [Polyangiaceae bacterium]|nr:hypothetical protein [Polyangiaceae bacterium]
MTPHLSVPKSIARTVAGVAGLCCLVAPVYAAPGDVLTAEALFREGKALMAASKHAEACQKFEASQDLDPGLGTLLNLAQCHDAIGRTASAWSEYLEAKYQAQTAGRKSHADGAAARAKALEPRLVRLIIAVPNVVEGLSIQFNGYAVRKALFGMAQPVDPGESLLQVSAPGYKTWTHKLTITEEGSVSTVSVPELEKEQPVVVVAPVATPLAEPQAADPPAPAAVPASGSLTNVSQGVNIQPGGWSAMETTGFVVGALGLAAIAGGGVLAVLAKADYDDANCSEGECAAAADQQQVEDARQEADIGGAAVIAGGVLAATGFTIFLTSNSSDPATDASVRLSPVVANGFGALQLFGRF